MAATEHDDDRWRQALDLARENAQQYQTLVRIVQNGFGSIGTRLNDHAEHIADIDKMVKAIQSVGVDCQQRLAKVEADGNARARMTYVLMVLVFVLLLASFAQTGLWWYVVTRLFHL